MTRTTPIAMSVLLCVLAGCSNGNRSEEVNAQPAAPAASSSSAATAATTSAASAKTGTNSMRLGNFSVSLTVKDIAASRAFYEKLGFHVKDGNQAQNWLVMQNETSTIGLFQGMFPKNTLTFNPGWDRAASTLPDFDDVRELQRRIKAQGLTLKDSADESTTGPAYITLIDPDGNPILIDQHVPAPKK